MTKSYIIPQLSEIKIDNEISLRLATNPNDGMVLEPGDGSAGIGGEGNDSGETGWGRTSLDSPKINDFQGNNIWN